MVEPHQAEVRATVESRRDYLLYAFELLTQGKPTLDKATWVRLYRTLVPRADEPLAELNWRVIDVHDRGCIGPRPDPAALVHTQIRA